MISIGVFWLIIAVDMASPLDGNFLRELASAHDGSSAKDHEFKWYITAIVAVAGMNYSELIPELYKTLLAEYIPEDKHFSETRKLREALTKTCGIWGAAKVRPRSYFFAEY